MDRMILHEAFYHDVARSLMTFGFRSVQERASHLPLRSSVSCDVSDVFLLFLLAVSIRAQGVRVREPSMIDPTPSNLDTRY